MKQTIKKLIRISLTPFILVDYMRFRRNSDGTRFSLSLARAYPCIKDKTIQTGFDRHYVYHTSWAARILSETKPTRHVDISSSLFFAGIASAFVPIDFYDYRPAEITLSDLTSNHADIAKLPFEDNSVPSLSCMHVIEHIGLGRYGDSIDPSGDIKAASELSRVLAPEGRLIIVVPMGAKALIEYNAHRIYSYAEALNLFPSLSLVEFTLIPERSGPMIRNANPSLLETEHYAAGCFVFKK